MRAIRDEIKVGQSENYLAGLLVFELRSRGASDSSFPVIVAAGANSSLPHYRPGETLVRKDEPLLIDWGAIFGGYCSDLTRTLLIGGALSLGLALGLGLGTRNSGSSSPNCKPSPSVSCP